MWFQCFADHTLRKTYWLRCALSDGKILFPDRKFASDWASNRFLTDDVFPDADEFEKVPLLELEPAAVAPGAGRRRAYVLSQFSRAASN